MKKLLIVCALLGAASPALAQDRGNTPAPVTVTQERAALGVLLAAHHKTPSKEAFEATSKRAAELLESMAAQADLMPAHRARALDALGAYYPNARVRLLFAGVVTNADTPEGLRHSAMLLGARHFGADFVPTLVTQLGVQDVQLRYTAVEALAHIGDTTALAALKKASASETSSFVKERMERALMVVR